MTERHEQWMDESQGRAARRSTRLNASPYDWEHSQLPPEIRPDQIDRSAEHALTARFMHEAAELDLINQLQIENLCAMN
jgi:hypothetical protein